MGGGMLPGMGSQPGAAAGGPSAGCLRVLAAVSAALSWSVVSSAMIVINQRIMVELGFHYPMTVAGLGLLTSSVLSFVVCRVLGLVDLRFPDVTWGYWVRKCLVVGLFQALTLGMGNSVYLFLSVAFIQVLKAFNPVVVLLCLTLAGMESPSRAMIASVVLTAGGTALAAYGELNLSVVGVLLMLGAETCEALRLVMTQWLLTGMSCHPLEGLMLLAPAGTLWLAAGAAISEFPRITRAGHWAMFSQYPAHFASTALMGFAVNVLSFWTIKLASSLTLKVLGTVKNALLVVFSVVFLGETVTSLTATGYGVSLAGFVWYNQMKLKQIAAGQPVSGPKQVAVQNAPPAGGVGDRHREASDEEEEVTEHAALLKPGHNREQIKSPTAPLGGLLVERGR